MRYEMINPFNHYLIYSFRTKLYLTIKITVTVIGNTHVLTVSQTIERIHPLSIIQRRITKK